MTKELKPVLYIKRNIQTINRYIIGGLLTMAIEVLFFYLFLYVFAISPSIANVFSLVVSAVFNYIISRFWVFSKSKHTVFKEFFLYTLAFLFTLALSYIVFNASLNIFLLSPTISKAVSIVFTVSFNYIVKKYLVFKSE